MDTFLNDLKRVVIYCKDEKIKELLKEKDKDKAGESGGIGTPATRSEIIKTLYERGYITDSKNNIISTNLGKDLISILSETITYPDMTALWHESTKNIGTDMNKLNSFLDSVNDFSKSEIEKIKSNDTTFKNNNEKCPTCKTGYLTKRKGKFGHFWSCSNYPECKTTFQDKNNKPDIYENNIRCPVCEKSELQRINGKNGIFWRCRNEECNKKFKDNNGKPNLNITEQPTISEKYRCLECNSKLIRRKGQRSYFWGCSAYPKCKTVYKDNNGEPIYDKEYVEKK